MAKMNKEQMRAIAVKKVLEMLTFPEITENAGRNGFAIPVEVEGEEIFVKIDLTAKQWYDTERTKAYDPFTEQAEWESTLAEREKTKIERERKKAEKLARQKAKREQVEKNKGKVILG